jgi:hypothetical protein
MAEFQLSYFVTLLWQLFKGSDICEALQLAFADC